VNISPIAKSSIAALLAAVALVWAGFSEQAAADIDVTTLSVAVAVDVRCVISSGSVNFGGTYNPGQLTPHDGQGIVIVQCDPGRKVSIKLGQGLYPAPGSTDNSPLRRMAHGTARLDYNLYEDAARTIVWDNRNNAVRTTRIYPFSAIIYGRIPALQIVPQGYYSDTVVSTVNY
jgi:spore coat protein U-like protein